MNEHPNEPHQLCIWQQNCRKSLNLQLDVVNSLDPELYDICAIQEPYIDFNSNSRTPPNWTTIYPPPHYANRGGRTRSIILISPNITNCTPIPINSPDVTSIQIETTQGSLRLINAYVDQAHNHTIDIIRLWHDQPEAATLPPSPTFSTGPATHTICLGDFNRHHPLWDDDHQDQLFTARALRNADTLIQTIMHLGLIMALPKGTNTYQTAEGNWTRPDNVFASPEVADLIIQCNIDPSIRPIHSDHLPIVTVLDIRTEAAAARNAHAWKATNWEEFRDSLETTLRRLVGAPSRIETYEQLERTALLLDQAIEEVRDQHVREVTISPHTKRWWTPELTLARQLHRKLKLKSHKQRMTMDHLVHAEARAASQTYDRLISDAKSEHWMAFIADVTDGTAWKVHQVLKTPATDGGRTRLPTLDERIGENRHRACSNQEKADTLHRAFFPCAHPPPPAPAPDAAYPEPVEPFQEMTNKQVQRAIEHLDPWKAVMSGDVPNAMLKHTATILVPYLGELYRATFRLQRFPLRWKQYETIFLRKPDKPDYTLAKAYRPICLLKTIAKPLSIATTEYLSYLAERYQLLAPTQFGFRPGRATTDAILLAENFIKNAWYDKDVVSGLFLDVKGAFPSVSIPRLTHDLRMKGIPQDITGWLAEKLRGR
jgi:hypothetical protein